jgi:hypothetical protein
MDKLPLTQVDDSLPGAISNIEAPGLPARDEQSKNGRQRQLFKASFASGMAHLRDDDVLSI